MKLCPYTLIIAISHICQILYTHIFYILLLSSSFRELCERLGRFVHNVNDYFTSYIHPSKNEDFFVFRCYF